MRQHNYFVYIVTNASKTVLYTGVTNDLESRLCEHYLNRGKEKTFAGKYYCYNLLHFERFQYVDQAIAREKEIKLLVRRSKLELIEVENPTLRFLNDEVSSKWPPDADAEGRVRYQ